jgi:hypothetical protein
MWRFLLRVRRWLRAEIVFGFLIATVFWAAVLGWQAAYAPTDSEKQKCHEAAERSGHKGEECKTLWERTTSDPVAFFTFWLSISTIGLWIVTWQSGKRQSKDMTESIDVAERALVAGERAWLRVEIRVASNLNISLTGITLPLLFKVTNCGSSPATNVRVFHNLLLNHPGRMETMEAYRQFSANVRTRAEREPAVDFMSYTVFPDETKPFYSRAYVQPQSIKDAADAWEKAVEERLPYFDLFMVGCVAYRIPFDDRQHQTGFSVNIKRRIDGTEDWGIFRLDETSVNPSDIGIFESAWGSPSID